MTEEKRNELYTLSIARWGKNLQRLMMIEECSELIQAIAKDIRNNDFNMNDKDVCGELADCEIMIEQMRLVYNTTIIDVIKEQKLIRLEKRLELEKEKK